MNGLIMIALALLLGVDKVLSGPAVEWLRTGAAVLLLVAGIIEVAVWLRARGWLEWKKSPPAPRSH